MAMGRRGKQLRQEPLWIAHSELPRTVAHPFYEQLNRLLEERGFDDFVEQQCARFYAERMGRPSLPPGRYFRLLLIGYFEGIDGRTGDRVAGCRFAGAAQFSWGGTERAAAGSLHDLAHAATNRVGHEGDQRNAGRIGSHTQSKLSACGRTE